MRGRDYIMKKIILMFFLLLLIFFGCDNNKLIVFMQVDTDNESYGTNYILDFNVNTGSENNYKADEYIEPLDIEPEDIKWVSVMPKNSINRPLKVGFSQMEVNNAWRIYENASIFQEAQKLGIEVIYKNAEGSIIKQKEHIFELIEEDVDYLLVAPREYYGLKDSFEAARKAEIPVILLDRIAEGEPGIDYVTCIMGDFIEIGRRAALILAEKFPGQKIYVFEVSGTIGASFSRDLSKGFRSIAEPLGWKIKTVDGDCDRAASVKPIEEVLQSDRDSIQAIFTHVDDSAIVALQAMKAMGMKPGINVDEGDIPIVSMCGYKDAMKAIIAKEMLATIECSPRFGPIVFKYIHLLEKGEAIKSRIVMPGKTYDITNSAELINKEGY